MQYVIEILKGICMSFGIAIGFVLIAVTIIHISRRESGQYKADELTGPFSDYWAQILADQRFEEMAAVQDILNALKKNIVPPEVDLYQIDEKRKLVMDEDGGKTGFDVVTIYKIKGLKKPST